MTEGVFSRMHRAKVTQNDSNKNTQLDATFNRKIYCFVVQTLLNMFRALLCPSSGARQTAVAASGFRMNVEVEVFSAVAGLVLCSFCLMLLYAYLSPACLALTL